jgi:hypothetical protein
MRTRRRRTGRGLRSARTGRLWRVRAVVFDHVGIAARQRWRCRGSGFPWLPGLRPGSRRRSLRCPTRDGGCSRTPARRRCGPLRRRRARLHMAQVGEEASSPGSGQRGISGPSFRVPARRGSGSAKPAASTAHRPAGTSRPGARSDTASRHRHRWRRWPSVHSHICMAVASAQAPVPGRSDAITASRDPCAELRQEQLVGHGELSWRRCTASGPS